MGISSGYSRKQLRVMKAIRAVAKDKGFDRFKYYKIMDFEIWDKLVDLGYSRNIYKKNVKMIRHTLPKCYFNSYFK